jgi:hypothetical protein
MQPELLDAQTINGILDYTPEARREVLAALGYDDREAVRKFLESVTREAYDNWRLSLDGEWRPGSGPPRKPLPLPMTLDELAKVARRAYEEDCRPEDLYPAFWDDAHRRADAGQFTSRQREWLRGGLGQIFRGLATKLGEMPPAPPPVDLDEVCRVAVENLRADAANRERMRQNIVAGHPLYDAAKTRSTGG